MKDCFYFGGVDKHREIFSDCRGCGTVLFLFFFKIKRNFTARRFLVLVIIIANQGRLKTFPETKKLKLRSSSAIIIKKPTSNSLNWCVDMSSLVLGGEEEFEI